MDFGKNLFPAMLGAGQRLLGYNTPEYIKDIGTPERYDRVSAESASGVIARSSLQTPQPTVFMDRDGTLNREVDGVTSPEKLELLPGVAEAIYKLNRSGIRAVVISNQPIIAKGFCIHCGGQMLDASECAAENAHLMQGGGDRCSRL